MINSQSKKVLSSINIYYEYIEDFLHKKFPEKENQILELRDMLKDIPHNSNNNWESAHYFHYTYYILDQIYKILDFRIDADSDISSTRGSEIEQHLTNLHKIYKLYMVDWMRLYNNMLVKAFNIEKNQPITTWIENFEKYPHSIDLYIMLMKQSSDKNKQKQIEIDKSKALGENEFISPYLTFNAIPSELLTLSDIFKSDKSISHIAEGFGNIIVIKRHINSTYFYNLPKFSITKSGPSENTIQTVLTKHEFNEDDDWSLNIYKSDIDKYIILEEFSSKYYRILYSNPHKSLISKIMNKQFGRPHTYNKLITKNFTIKSSIKKLSANIPKYKIDINLLISNIKEIVRSMAKTDLKKMLLNKPPISPVLMNELDKFTYPKYLNCVLVAKMQQIDNKFYSEMIKNYSEHAPDKSNIMAWVDKHSTIILDSILRSNNNIFQLLNISIYYDIIIS